MSCPVCNNDKSILLRNTSGIEKGYRTKDDYTWNIDIHLCMSCKNIFGKIS
ncbi:hypothetical protein LCGC14_0224720 [marine sediment metagenome]|uniref:Uncharacterized protein n=1 Tax=marine sediment metagenome TaxID=412755 RepID=A0A0F9XG67_9ZZZZ